MTGETAEELVQPQGCVALGCMTAHSAEEGRSGGVSHTQARRRLEEESAQLVDDGRRYFTQAREGARGTASGTTGDTASVVSSDVSIPSATLASRAFYVVTDESADISGVYFGDWKLEVCASSRCSVRSGCSLHRLSFWLLPLA